MAFFSMKLVKCNEYLVSIVKAFSNNNVEYGSMRFQLFMG